jgi:hypothetical protein
VLIVAEQDRVDGTDLIHGGCRTVEPPQCYVRQVIGSRRNERWIGQEAQAIKLDQNGGAANVRQSEHSHEPMTIRGQYEPTG